MKITLRDATHPFYFIVLGFCLLQIGAANAQADVPAVLKNATFGDAIDLVEQVDIERDARGKSWTKSDGSLNSSKSGRTLLTVPVSLPENYIIRATIQRVENNDSLGIGFRVGSSGTILMLNFAGGKSSGFYYLDDLKPDDDKNATTTKSNQISDTTASELMLAVIGNRVVITIDGKSHIDWQGDPTRLSIKGWNDIPNAERLTLSSYGCSWKISRLEITPILAVSKQVPPDAKTVEALQKQLEKDLGFSLRVSNPIECATLSKRLSSEALQEQDANRQFALLSTAADFAARSGDGQAAWTIIDVAGETFEFDVLQNKLEILRTLSRLRTSAMSPYILALRCHDLALLAVESHDYTKARQLMRESLGFARRGRYESLITQLTELDRLWASWEQSYAKVRDAHHVVLADPSNEAACRTWGRFLCVTCGRWQDGLPVLARSVDPLSALAVRELESPEDFQAISNLMNDWLSAAEKETKSDADTVRNHAYDVGQKAISLATEPQLTTLLSLIESGFGQTRIWSTHNTNTGIDLGYPQANIGAEGTVELWLRTRESDGCVIKKRLESAELTIGMRIQNGTVGYYAQGFNYAAFQFSQQRVDDGKWHHLAIVKQGNQLRLFIDGKPAGEPGEIRPDLKSNANWHIGYSRVDNRLPLHASFSRIRVSGIARYHVPFVPERQYGPDRATMMLE